MKCYMKLTTTKRLVLPRAEPSNYLSNQVVSPKDIHIQAKLSQVSLWYLYICFPIYIAVIIKEVEVINLGGNCHGRS